MNGNTTNVGYPNEPLGQQKRPLSEAFDGFKMLREHFADERNVKPFVRIYEAMRDMPYMEQVPAIAADTEKALKRAVRRAEELSGEWERVEFVPTRGPTTEFTGRLLIEDEYESKGRDPIRAHMQIWETKGGALVAIDETQRLDGVSTPRLAVAVCPPTGDDAQEQRFAVMEHFGWSTRARSMARKLGWSLRTEVE